MSCPNPHWLIAQQSPITQIEGIMVDRLYQRRLKTLLSVDDITKELDITLSELEVINNTIFIFTSDNGFRLGQFSMPMSKFHPYENDVRVPMLIRGPIDIITSNNISDRNNNYYDNIFATHVDLMPTLLGLVHKNSSQDIVPQTMDGSNLAGVFLNPKNNNQQQNKFPLKKSILIEYKSLGNTIRYNHQVDAHNHTFLALRIIDPAIVNPKYRNIKYIEFRNSHDDWNNIKPPTQIELFNLDEDPYEINNIANATSRFILQLLSKKIQSILHCKGRNCHEEMMMLPLFFKNNSSLVHNYNNMSVTMSSLVL